MSIGHWEIILAILVIIIFFGGKRIPELARGIGKGLVEFKKTKKIWQFYLYHYVK